MEIVLLDDGLTEDKLARQLGGVLIAILSMSFLKLSFGM
jgi:hypothetical protein